MANIINTVVLYDKFLRDGIMRIVIHFLFAVVVNTWREISDSMSLTEHFSLVLNVTVSSRCGIVPCMHSIALADQSQSVIV